MANTTAILKAAASARKRVLAQQDAEAAFEWENSAQTYEDYVNYSKYLQDRQQTTSDPSQALSYDRTLRSARRSYTSNELQRQQMAIMEGRATTSDKMDLVKDLFYQAQENGDFNLAQNLLSQWDTLSIKLQNEQEAGAKAFASSNSAAKDALTKQLTGNLGDVTLPDGRTVVSLGAIAEDLRTTGGSDKTWEFAEETLQALAEVEIAKYENATTQDEQDALETKYGANLENLYDNLKFKIGGKDLSFQDVSNIRANAQFNNELYSLKSIYNEGSGKNEFKLQENKVDSIDYVRQIDPETGEDTYVSRDSLTAAPQLLRTPESDSYFGYSDIARDLNARITNEGAIIGEDGMTKLGTEKVDTDESQSYKNRLKELGYEPEVVEVEGKGRLVIRIPGTNVVREAVIQPDGSIRYIDIDKSIKEFNVFDTVLDTVEGKIKQKAGQARIVAPDEISDFGTNSNFGGKFSTASKAGRNYIEDISGNRVAPSGVIKGNIRTGNDFAGEGTGVRARNLQGTTAVLQSAGATRQAIQAEQQRKQMLQAQAEAAARLQASQNMFNLNQTPVRQFASNGIRLNQLKAVNAAPQRITRVSVAAPQKISSVGVAQPGRISGVSVAPSYSGTLRVR